MPAVSEGARPFGPTRPSFRPTNAVRGPLRLSLAPRVLSLFAQDPPTTVRARRARVSFD
jgi:hypothetical protein